MEKQCNKEAEMSFDKKILVIGSVNTDMVVKTSHLPRKGETVMGGTFFMNSGGKGANQAVAVARLGGSVTFICKTGHDVFGQRSQQLFREESIDTSYVFSDPINPSGIALISVDDNAENCILVVPGANANLLPEDIMLAESAIDSSDLILIQLEIPMETVVYAIKQARDKNKKVILNPAPACKLSSDVLNGLYLITPNETEAEILSGLPVFDEQSAILAAQEIYAKGVENVIITMGTRGALVYTKQTSLIVPAYKVKAVDTTAAGDVFNGALTVALSEGKDIVDSVRFACKASAISVTRLGAQDAVPYRKEVDLFG